MRPASAERSCPSCRPQRIESVAQLWAWKTISATICLQCQCSSNALVCSPLILYLKWQEDGSPEEYAFQQGQGGHLLLLGLGWGSGGFTLGLLLWAPFGVLKEKV